MYDTNTNTNNHRHNYAIFAIRLSLAIGTCLLLLSSCIYSIAYLNQPDKEIEKRLAMTLTLGTPVNYTANGVGNAGMAIARLDNTHVIALFYDTTDSNLKAVVASISSGTTVTAGTPAIVDASASDTSFDITSLSASKALVIYTASGGDIESRIITISGTTISAVGAANTVDVGGNSAGNTQAMSVTRLSVTEAVITYKDAGGGGAGTTRALDISGDTVTPGAAHVFDASNTFQMSVTVLTATTALASYLDGGSTPANRGTVVVLTKTGAVMTSGTAQTFTSLAISSAVVGSVSGSLGVVAYRDSAGSLTARTLSVSGTTITVNSGAAIDVLATNSAVSISKIDSNTVIVTSRRADNSTYAVEGIISGTTISGGTPIQVSATVGLVSDGAVYLSPHVAVVYGDEIVAVTSSNAASPTITNVAPMPKPCSINADGDFIYLAGLNASGFPILIKFPAALDAGGTLVFDPAIGTNIGVECGRLDGDVVWIAGEIDGAYSTAKSEDAGVSFAEKDSQFAAITAFKVGPDSDERVLVVTDDIDIYETIDDGANWTQIAASTGIETKAIDRLDENVDETVFGNESAVANNIWYSVNSGADREDYTSGFDQQTDINGIIVG